MTSYWLEHAVDADGAMSDGLRLSVDAGRITAREITAAPAPGDVRLTGLSVPGLANAHSHAFHRALRARTQRDRGSFWTWRELMYQVAGRLDPDNYYRLARAAYAEMALAGIAVVGEFHYVHHSPDGSPYSDPNATGKALIAAARDAGIRITLLDTCYLAGGIGLEPAGAQVRFSDGTVERWVERVADLAAEYAGADDVIIGAAVHSVRAVPADAMAQVAAWTEQAGAPLHVHLSEQPAENEACQAAYGATPSQVLAEHGVLSDRAVAVHATHMTDGDLRLLATSGTGVCLCPTTERDLADGIGRSGAMVAEGIELSLGSDSNAIVDLFEEARATELDERLATIARGHFDAELLLTAATVGGHRALGDAGAGGFAVGQRADIVTVRTDSVRTAGAGLGAEMPVFAATAADVTDVTIGGRQVVAGGRHLLVEDVPGELAASITPLTGA